MVTLTDESSQSAPGRNLRTHFTIDVFPHVKKFIFKTYRNSTEGRDTVTLEKNSTLSNLVTLALREPSSSAEGGPKRDSMETITLVLTKNQSGLNPSLRKLRRINVDMDRLFKEHLMSWITANEDHFPPYSACRQFLEHYRINEKEYSLAAAYRFYQRSRHKDFALDSDTKHP